VGRSRYRRRHPPLVARGRPRRRPPSVTERFMGWSTVALVGVFALWFVDARTGLLRTRSSPLLALVVDAGAVAVVALVLVIRRMRR
jgi:hypothetical protein